MKKSIEVVELKVGDLKTGFGNPRKISKGKRDELERSLDTFGDFGLIVIDEDNNIIAGNQRCSVLLEKSPDTTVLCKRIVGYSTAEKRAINIKANTHAGEWDYDVLADWTADLSVDLGITESNKKVGDRKINEMELLHYEKYDYILIACKDSFDYDELVSKLGIQGAVVYVTNKRKIQGRAVWYHKIREKLFGKEENKGEATQ